MKKLILFLLTILLIFGCSPKPKVYYFVCNEQKPDIVYSLFPKAIQELGYDINKIVKDSNLIIASKPILRTNKSKGVEKQFIEIKFYFIFNSDTSKSEITQYHVVEMNGKEKISSLNEEQLKLYEKDVLTLQEKLLFYCDPRFKGR
jgi:hypothetical protein